MTASSRKLYFEKGGSAEAPASRRPISVAERLSSPQVGLLWLVRLRWHALVAIALAMTLAPWLMGVTVLWVPALAVVSGIALSNLGSLLWVRSGRPVRSEVLAVLILADTLLLTAAFAVSGGALNPFVTLYVIEVTLAALLLDVAWVAAVAATSVAGYALLLASAQAVLPALGTGSSVGALALTLGINATLVVRMVKAFRERQDALARAQREAASAERLASLTTLAAGAAHELATPLGSIAIAATELEALIGTEPEQARLEARVIREQVSRCKHILQRLGARAGSEPGELARRTNAREAVASLRHELGTRAARLETLGDPDLAFDTPLESLTAVLANLVNNGLGASAAELPVTLSWSQDGDTTHFSISDRGAGIEASLLPRLGEPFLTTKAPGEGLGLGLFLAFRFAAQQGGRLHIESTKGQGTQVRLDLPRLCRGAA